MHALHFRDGRAVVAWKFRESLPPFGGGLRVVSGVSNISEIPSRFLVAHCLHQLLRAGGAGSLFAH